jgi:hypothetical protein
MATPLRPALRSACRRNDRLIVLRASLRRRHERSGNQDIDLFGSLRTPNTKFFSPKSFFCPKRVAQIQQICTTTNK